MTTALLSLGSNMGESWAYLRVAVDTLGSAVVAVSSVYRTPPWGPVAQDDFLNIAVLVTDPAVDAAGWLERCHEVERAANRERLVRWGPRTLDADVIAVWRGEAGRGEAAEGGGAGDGVADSDGGGVRGGSAYGGGARGESAGYDGDLVADTEPVISADPVLTLPHPRAAERGFVLVPWAEIQPNAELPGRGPITTLIAALDVSDIERVGALDDGPQPA